MLQHAQQLDLRRRRRLADFVEEERSAGGRGEEALLVLDRAGERSLHVAEQFALEQALGKRAAVDRQERPVGTRRQLVDVARDDFLTGARLALDRAPSIRSARRSRRGAARRSTTCSSRRAARNRCFAPADLLLERLVLDPQLAMLRGAPQDRDQLVVAERLLDVVEGALVHRLHGRLQRGLRGHEDHRRRRVLLARRRQHLDAVTFGMRTSVSTMSGDRLAICSSPCLPPCATCGVKPSLRSRMRSESRMPDSSSMTSTLVPWLPLAHLASAGWSCSLGNSTVTRVPLPTSLSTNTHAAMRLDRAMHDREPEPAAAGLRGEKRIEHLLAHVERNAGPVVGDADRDATTGQPARPGAHPRRASTSRRRALPRPSATPAPR